MSDTWNPMTGAVEPCSSGNYQGWRDMFYCIQPASWAFLGVALALALSILGAAW